MPEDFTTAYFGDFRTADGKYGIVFTSEKLISALGDPGTQELFIDGTFDAQPKEPKSCQLLVVHTRKRDSGVPVMLVLCETRTKAFYNAFWTFIRDNPFSEGKFTIRNL